MPSACASPQSAFEARFPLVGSFPEVLYPHLIRFGQANISCDKMHVFCVEMKAGFACFVRFLMREQLKWVPELYFPLTTRNRIVNY